MKQMTETCGCCEGIEILTPQLTANRPGLTVLSYRIGTHATFLETMLARLSGSDYPKLADLTTRESDDPSIALMDAWAIVADVLTFYNERIINEGYLRTGTERRSILELARLVGYKLRPGVASSVYLAYTLDDIAKDEVIIPNGARSQSIPGPGELPQSFEVSKDLKARAKWNNLKPRLTQPQTADSIRQGDGKNQRIYLKGINTNLKPNDPLLIDFTGKDDPNTVTFDRVKEVKPDPGANRTLVILQSEFVPDPKVTSLNAGQEENNDIGLIEALTQAPSVQPANSLKLERNLREQFGGVNQGQQKGEVTGLRETLVSGEASHSALKAFAPVLNETLATAAANATVTQSSKIKVYALRSKAGLFGHNYPGVPVSFSPTIGVLGSEAISSLAANGNSFLTLHIPVPLNQFWPEELLKDSDKGLAKIALDPQNEQLQKGGWVVMERPKLAPTTTDPKRFPNCDVTGPGRKHSIHKITDVQQITLSGRQIGNFFIGFNSEIGFTSKVNLLTIDQPWLYDEIENIKNNLLGCISLLRETTAYTQSEELELAEEPSAERICGGIKQLIELDGFYEGLEAGRWVIVSGEREISGISGVRFNELAMLASVSQDTRNIDVEELEGDKLHTFIKLAEELKYCFKRDSVTIYGNVVEATHGETRQEVLGSGDGAKSLQSFTLRQPPLTYVAASNPSGVDSTLKIYVNDVEWHETDALAGLSTTDRNFITNTDDEDKTALIFGNGREGARLPTGIENIRAVYRNGIGKPGNVNAGQISLLTTRPLGVKEVINPLRASGGADKESHDQARKNAPLAVKALDRLVSVQDYEDFARIFAGIGKARATELSDGRRQVVHVTIAGVDDIPIDKNSDLYRNLRQALLDFGDPYQAIQLEVRELMLIVIEARIRILPDYLWEPVVTQVRTALLDAFGFEQRELGQDVLFSEVLSVMQAVRGVAYVDVDLLRGIPEKIVDTVHPGQRRLLTPGEIANLVSQPLIDKDGKDIKEPLSRISVNLADREDGTIRPAQLAFLTPEVPATLNLKQIT